MVFAREAAGKVFFTKKSGVLWTFSSLRSPQAIISLVCTSTTKMTPYMGLKRRSILSIFSARNTFFWALMWVESMTSISGGTSGVTAAVMAAWALAMSSAFCSAGVRGEPSAMAVSMSLAPESLAALSLARLLEPLLIVSAAMRGASGAPPPKMQEPIMKHRVANIPRAIMRLRSRWA